MDLRDALSILNESVRVAILNDLAVERLMRILRIVSYDDKLGIINRLNLNKLVIFLNSVNIGERAFIINQLTVDKLLQILPKYPEDTALAIITNLPPYKRQSVYEKLSEEVKRKYNSEQSKQRMVDIPNLNEGDEQGIEE